MILIQIHQYFFHETNLKQMKSLAVLHVPQEWDYGQHIEIRIDAVFSTFYMQVLVRSKQFKYLEKFIQAELHFTNKLDEYSTFMQITQLSITCIAIPILLRWSHP